MKNMGNIDRLLRVLIGLIISIWAISYIDGFIAYLLLIIGIILIVTALFAYCGFYQILGIKTCKIKTKKIIVSKDDLRNAITEEPDERVKDFYAKKSNFPNDNRNLEKKLKLETNKNEEIINNNSNSIKKIGNTTSSRHIKPLSDLKGIKQKEIILLNENKIEDTADFLRICKTKKGRKDLAKNTLINEKDLLTWANQIDLYRIKGIGVEYSYLLHESGVNTIPELALRNSENLLKKMKEVNEMYNYVKIIPSLNQIEDWKKQAKKLKKQISY